MLVLNLGRLYALAPYHSRPEGENDCPMSCKMDEALDDVFDVFYQDSGFLGEVEADDVVVALIDATLLDADVSRLCTHVLVGLHVASFMLAPRLTQRVSYRARARVEMSRRGYSVKEVISCLPDDDSPDIDRRGFATAIGDKLRGMNVHGDK